MPTGTTKCARASTRGVFKMEPRQSTVQYAPFRRLVFFSSSLFLQRILQRDFGRYFIDQPIKYCLQFEFCFSPKSDLMNYHFICVIKTWEWKGNIQRSKIIKVTPTLHTCDLCGFIYCICCSSSLSQIPPLPLAIHWFTGTNRCYPLKTISFHSLPPAPT